MVDCGSRATSRRYPAALSGSSRGEVPPQIFWSSASTFTWLVTLGSLFPFHAVDDDNLR